MNQPFNLNDLLNGIDADLVEIQDDDRLKDGYEVEVYYDVYQWHPSGNYRTSDTILEGDSISPIEFIDAAGNIDNFAFIEAIRQKIRMAIESEDRASIVEVLA